MTIIISLLSLILIYKYYHCYHFQASMIVSSLLLLLLPLLIKPPGPALVSSEIDQGALLEQATGRVLRLRIEWPCTEAYC